MSEDDEAARKEQAAKWREQIRKVTSPDQPKAGERPAAESQAHPAQQGASEEQQKAADESPPPESARDFVRRKGFTGRPRGDSGEPGQGHN